MPKVFIFGIDGGSLDLINLWGNNLPNFSKLIRNGTSGYLHTIIPMLTPPGWTSFATGKNPAKHNIFDFFKIKNYNKELINSYDRKTEALWDVLSRNNKKSIILNLPATYPPQPLNGIMICGAETPSIKTDFTYPRDYKEKIFKLNPDYKTGIDPKNLEYKNYEALLEDLYKVTNYYKNLILHIIENEEWDLFIAVFEDVDRLQHYLWKYMDSKHPAYVKGNKFENAIHDYYKKLDNILGEILLKLPKDVNLFVISDHGFGPIYKQIFINNFLLEKGYLKLKSNIKENKINVKDFLIKIAYKLKIKHLIFRLPEKMRNKMKNLIPSQDLTNVDWNGTKAYFNSYSGQYILINLKGRDPNGIIEENEYNEILKNLKNDLFNLEDNGKKIIKNVYSASEIYNGENLKNAPDLFVITEDGYILQEGFNSKLIDLFNEDKVYRSADHRDNGILIIYGENVKQNYKLEANILDIFPTILKIFNIQISEDVDGKIISCFN